jgi:hypothetical protein
LIISVAQLASFFLITTHDKHTFVLASYDYNEAHWCMCVLVKKKTISLVYACCKNIEINKKRRWRNKQPQRRGVDVIIKAFIHCFLISHVTPPSPFTLDS